MYYVKIRSDWLIDVKSYGNKKLPIFKNPTNKESKEVSEKSRLVRFALNYSTGDFYIWDENTTHFEVINQLYKLKLIKVEYNIRDIMNILKYFFLGVGIYTSGKFKIVDSDTINYTIFRHDHARENKKLILNLLNKHSKKIAKWITNLPEYLDALNYKTLV